MCKCDIDFGNRIFLLGYVILIQVNNIWGLVDRVAKNDQFLTHSFWAPGEKWCSSKHFGLNACPKYFIRPIDNTRLIALSPFDWCKESSCYIPSSGNAKNNIISLRGFVQTRRSTSNLHGSVIRSEKYTIALTN